MPLETFAPPYNPTISGSSKKVLARTREALFGDGYSQRAGDGLNTTPRKFSAQWDKLLFADADDMEDFFEDHAGFTAFLWTLPDESIVRKWVVKQWSRGYQGGNIATVTAEFEEVFDL